MRLQWLGHSSFLIEESTGTKLVIDPFDCEYVGGSFPDLQCDVVTISNNKKDHNYRDTLYGTPEVIDVVGAFETKGIHIYSFNSKKEINKKENANLIFNYRVDGVNVCHLGDISCKCSPIILDNVGSCNVLLIPVGGNHTIDAETAKEYVDLIMPDYVIPMHYKSRDSKLDLDKVNDFVEYFDSEDIEYINGNQIEFNRAQFDGESTKIIIFE